MLTTKEIVKAMLAKYPRARSSDEYLLDCIIDHYFEGDVIYFFTETPAVQFITSMNRARRRFQMKGMYPATKKVEAIRKRHSKYWKSEMKATKKDIEKISLLKTKKRGKIETGTIKTIGLHPKNYTTN